MEGNPVNPSQDNFKSFDWKSKRIAPHWSLLVAALVIWVFLIDILRPVLSPLSMSAAILILLYPSRRIRAIKPLLFLAFLTGLISLWLRLSALLSPFIIAFLLAYAFDPAISWSVRRGLPRILSVLILVLGFMSIIIGTAILVIPRLVTEIGGLASALPDWIALLRTWITDVLMPWAGKMDIPTDQIWHELQPRLPAIFKTMIGGLADWGAKAVTGVMSLMTGVANLILIPILTIYFLNDFGKLRSWVYRLFPDEYKEDALKAYYQLNDAISAFVRGQLIVCLFLAVWIGTGLLVIARLPYAILIGVAAGLLNLIPYVGTTTALIVTIAVSMFQDDPFMTAVKSLIVFVSGQMLESNLLTPRIVGDKVGLHALVVIFIVLLFATFFGLIGMLIAIPVGAGVNVLWKVWRDRQKRIAEKFFASSQQP